MEMAITRQTLFMFFRMSLLFPISSLTLAYSASPPVLMNASNSAPSLNLTERVAALPVTICTTKPPDPFKPLSLPTYCELTLSEIRTDFEHNTLPQYWGPPQPPYMPATYRWQAHSARGCRIVLKPQKWGDVGYFSPREVETTVRVLLKRCQGTYVGARGPYGYGGIRTVGRDGEGAMGREDRISRWVVYLFNASTGYSERTLDNGGRAHL